jgi:hypothetical protein
MTAAPARCIQIQTCRGAWPRSAGETPPPCPPSAPPARKTHGRRHVAAAAVACAPAGGACLSSRAPRPASPAPAGGGPLFVVRPPPRTRQPCSRARHTVATAAAGGTLHGCSPRNGRQGLPDCCCWPAQEPAPSTSPPTSSAQARTLARYLPHGGRPSRAHPLWAPLGNPARTGLIEFAPGSWQEGTDRGGLDSMLAKLRPGALALGGGQAHGRDGPGSQGASRTRRGVAQAPRGGSKPRPVRAAAAPMAGARGGPGQRAARRGVRARARAGRLLGCVGVRKGAAARAARRGARRRREGGFSFGRCSGSVGGCKSRPCARC